MEGIKRWAGTPACCNTSGRSRQRLWVNIHSYQHVLPGALLIFFFWGLFIFIWICSMVISFKPSCLYIIASMFLWQEGNKTILFTRFFQDWSESSKAQSSGWDPRSSKLNCWADSLVTGSIFMSLKLQQMTYSPVLLFGSWKFISGRGGSKSLSWWSSFAQVYCLLAFLSPNDAVYRSCSQINLCFSRIIPRLHWIGHYICKIFSRSNHGVMLVFQKRLTLTNILFPQSDPNQKFPKISF